QALLPWSVEIYNLIGDPALIPALPVADLDTAIDLSLQKTVTPSVAEPGDPVTYRLRIRNDGPGRVLDAGVVDDVPASLEGCVWECFAERGSGCSMGESFGSLQALVDLPSQEELLFVGTCRVADDATGTIRNEASVTAPSLADDVDLSNNQDAAELEIGTVDSSLIFSDGFESGDTSAWTAEVN
ncbi:MAG: hypothetical protein AAFY88_30465, partial [Acidobacteriota bacterium]